MKIDFTGVVVRLARCIEFQVRKRDDAEQALSQAYYLVTGNSPRWSETFGYDEALEDIRDACVLMRASLKLSNRPHA
jgi:hypothetical protein